MHVFLKLINMKNYILTKYHDISHVLFSTNIDHTA